LYDVEEKRAERVGHLGIKILQALAELGVAIAMRASKWRIIAYTMYALLWSYRGWTMIVFSAAGVLG